MALFDRFRKRPTPDTLTCRCGDCGQITSLAAVIASPQVCELAREDMAASTNPVADIRRGVVPGVSASFHPQWPFSPPPPDVANFHYICLKCCAMCRVCRRENLPRALWFPPIPGDQAELTAQYGDVCSHCRPPGLGCDLTGLVICACCHQPRDPSGFPEPVQLPRAYYAADTDTVPVCVDCRVTCTECGRTLPRTEFQVIDQHEGRWRCYRCARPTPENTTPEDHGELAARMVANREAAERAVAERDEEIRRDSEAAVARVAQERRQAAAEERVRLAAQPVALGIGDNNQPVPLAADVRNRHLYIIGKTGSGKSSLLRNLIIQDMRAGRGLIYLDPHGDTAQQLLGYVPADRRDDVVYFCPADPDCPAFNLLATDYAPDKLTRDMVSAIKMFFGDSWGPRLNQLLTYALSTLLLDRDHEPHTLADLERLLLDEDYRDAIARRSSHPKLTAFWLQQFPTMARDAVHPVLNKLSDLLMPLSPMERIFSTPGNSLDLSAIMNSGKILLVNLSKGELGEAGAFLIGGLIVTAVAQAALARVKIPEPERVDCFFYVDEFQNFTVDSFESILSEARKYRLNLTLAHQYLKQVPANLQAAIFGNVAAVVCLPISADDAGTMQREMTTPGEQPTLGDELANIFNTPTNQHPGWTAPQPTRDWPTRQDFLTLAALTGFVKINTPENVQHFTIHHPHQWNQPLHPDPATRAAILDRQRREHETATAEKKRPPTIAQEPRTQHSKGQPTHTTSTKSPQPKEPDDFTF